MIFLKLGKKDLFKMAILKENRSVKPSLCSPPNLLRNYQLVQVRYKGGGGKGICVAFWFDDGPDAINNFSPL